MSYWYEGIVFHATRELALDAFGDLSTSIGLRLCELSGACFGIYPVHSDEDLGVFSGYCYEDRESAEKDFLQIAMDLSLRFGASFVVTYHSVGGGYLRIFVDGRPYAERSEGDECWFDTPETTWKKPKTPSREDRVKRRRPRQHIDESGTLIAEPSSLPIQSAASENYLRTA